MNLIKVFYEIEKICWSSLSNWLTFTDRNILLFGERINSKNFRKECCLVKFLYEKKIK